MLSVVIGLENLLLMNPPPMLTVWRPNVLVNVPLYWLALGTSGCSAKFSPGEAYVEPLPTPPPAISSPGRKFLPGDAAKLPTNDGENPIWLMIDCVLFVNSFIALSPTVVLPNRTCRTRLGLKTCT